MKIRASIKTLKKRDKNCIVVVRPKTRKDGSKKKCLRIVNKKNPRFKASQG